MKRWLMFVALLGAPLACGRPDVADLCEELDDDCPSSFDAEDCVTDGEEMEQKGDAAGCEEEVSVYFECLEEGICSWDTRCAGEREDVELCAGAVFPTR